MPFKWKVNDRQKLVLFLQNKAGGSGKKIRRELEKNSCRINGTFERFGSRWVEKGDVIEYFPREVEKRGFAILFENEHLQVVDKPAGWVCSEQNCRAHFGSGLFLVHRLDKDTTGALLLAKGKEMREELMALFASRSVEKEYLALVDGSPGKEEGTIQSFLAKKGIFQGQTIWGSAPEGDLAITHWSILKRGDRASLLKVSPETGRTHQIRVHMAEMGHPILVDRQYAKQYRSSLAATRPLLHAHRLRFTYRNVMVDVSAPIPTDLCPFL